MTMLRVEGLGKRFGRGGPAVLDGVGFSVEAGECVAVLGKSGCGKSTLARCIAGLMAVTEGRIEIEGREHRPRDGGERRRVQMVWQDPVGSLSPFVDVRSSLQEAGVGGGARLRELAEAVGLGGRLLGRRPHELSGGEAQRVAIARALAASPKVLLLDEPLSALDPVTQWEILPFLRKATHAPGRAALFISHDLTAVQQLADRILFLEGGRVVEDRPAADFLAGPLHPAARAFVAAWPDLPF